MQAAYHGQPYALPFPVLCGMLRVVRMSLDVLGACSAAIWCWSRVWLVKALLHLRHWCGFAF